MPDFYSIRVNPLEDVANQCTIVILDKEKGTFDDELALEAAGDPLQFKIIDNSEDPFTPIKSTQATIKFNSTANTNSNTFSSGSDERWWVLIVRGDLSVLPIKPIFIGHLIMKDIREDFMPIPNVVTLIATDGLGLLKEIPLQLPPPVPVTMERGPTDTDGRWVSNSTILNNNIQIDIHKRKLDGTPIWWVTALKEGDQITIVFAGDGTQRAVYIIGDTITDFGDYMSFENVILISGTDYSATNGEQYSIYFDTPELNPRGKYKIIEYISWCLQRTGTFEVAPPIINVAFNIKLSELTSDISTPNTDREHMFDTVYLDSKTFEDEIGTCINCYEVLKRILGEEAVLFQRNGQWWIVRIDEFNGITGTTGQVEGSEEVTNGDFASGSGWNLGAGWTITGGAAQHDGGAFFFANMNQSGSLTVGAQYRVRVTVGGTIGTVGITLGQSGTQILANAGDTVDFTGTYGGLGMIIRFDPQNTFNGSIDGVSIKSLTTGTISSRGFYVTQFDDKGVFIGNLGEKEYSKEIGKDAPYTIFFSEEQTTFTSDRSHGWVKETYNYDLPLEIPYNKDFSRGDLIDDSDPTNVKYNIEGWRFYKDIPADTQDNEAYIRRVINSFGVETDRYVVIGIASEALYYIESERIPLLEGDRFDFSVDWRLNSDLGSSGHSTLFVAQIRLFADNGTFWNLHGGNSTDPIPIWIESDSTWTTNQRYFVLEWDGDVDDTAWKTVSFWDNAPCPPIPFGLSGDITILLIASIQSDLVEHHFSNLQWTYIPYINGSYQKYEAQSNTVKRGDPRYKARRDNQVYMTDSPKPLFKGAMFKLVEQDILDLTNFIFTDNSDFFADENRINLPGDRTTDLFVGQQIQIQFTTLNNGTFTIIAIAYDADSNTTNVIVSSPLVDEPSVSATWYHSTFSLTSLSLIDNSGIINQQGFYDAALYPDGSGYVQRPYFEIQIYDLWNQFKAENKQFEIQCQGLDVEVTDVESLPGLAHILYMWRFRDDNVNTNDRIFYLLTFNQSLRLCDWNGTAREVGNATRDKTYVGNVFKYISR